MSEYIYERPDAPAKVVRDGWNVNIEWDFKQREEIVRCRDCEFFSEATTVDIHGNVIGSGCICEWTELWVKPEDFCSHGERKVDE